MKKSVLIALFLILLIIPVAFAFNLGNTEPFSLNNMLSNFFGKLTGEVVTSNSCADSDGGKDYYTAGTVKGSSNLGIYTKMDKCISNTALYEFYCANNNWVRETYTCPNGCSNGACIQQKGCNSDLECKQLYGENGYCRNMGGEGFNTCSQAVQCQSQSSLTYNQMYCMIDVVNNAGLHNESFICDADYFKELPEYHLCTEPQTAYITFKCLLNKFSQLSSQLNSCIQNITTPPIQQNTTCTDSDKGNDIYTPGYITFQNQSNKGILHDYCLNATRIAEAVCDIGNGDYGNIQQDCPNGGCNKDGGYCLKNRECWKDLDCKNVCPTSTTSYWCDEEINWCYCNIGSVTNETINQTNYGPIFEFYNPNISPDYIKDIIISSVWTNKDPQTYVLGESGTLWVKLLDADRSPLLPEEGGSISFTFVSDAVQGACPGPDCGWKLLVPYTDMGYNRDYNYYVATMTLPKNISKETLKSLRILIDATNGKMLSPGVINNLRFVGAFNQGGITNQTNPPIPDCSIIKSGGGYSYDYTIPDDPHFCFESCLNDKNRLLQIISVDMASNKLTIKVTNTGEVYKDLPFTLDQPTKLNDIDSRIILTIDQSSITLNQRVDCVLGPIVELTDEYNTCIFKGSNTKQTCYNNGIYQGRCSGIGSCMFHNGGLIGENLTWKSTCGGYGYTIMDGVDETIEFDCSNVTVPVNECTDKEPTILQGSTVCGITVVDVDEAETKCIIEYGGKTYIIDKGMSKQMDDGTVVGVISVTAVHEAGAGQDMCTIKIGGEIIPPTKCDGCLFNENCITYGIRTANSYCDISGSMLLQKLPNSYCNNNYECNSNICIANKCISENIWNRFVKWFARWFSR